MWSELDKQLLEREMNATAEPWSPEEAEQMVVMVRLELYNLGLPCGAAALHRRLDEHYNLRPLPPVRKIGEILARQGLINGRTGFYEGEN